MESTKEQHSENQHQFFSLKIEQFNVFRKKTWKWNYEMASKFYKGMQFCENVMTWRMN